MSGNVNFNLSQPQELKNLIYWNDKMGYSAIINGTKIGIHNIETVNGLKEIMPLVKVHESDIAEFEKAIIASRKK